MALVQLALPSIITELGIFQTGKAKNSATEDARAGFMFHGNVGKCIGRNLILAKAVIQAKEMRHEIIVEQAPAVEIGADAP